MDIVIVNHRTPRLLRRCLASLPSPRPGRVIVLDNDSGDESPALVEREFADVVLVTTAENTGFGGGVEQALRHSTDSTVLVLNADTELHGDTVASLECYLHEHPRCGLVGPWIVGADGSAQPSAFPWPTPLDYLLSETRVYALLRRLGIRSGRVLRLWDHDVARSVPWVLGCAFALRREAYDEVGGIDPGFPMYFEEADLCARLAAAHWLVDFTPDAVVMHVGAASTDQRRLEMRVQLYRSMARWYRRHRSSRSLVGLRCAVLLSLVPLAVRAALGLVGGGPAAVRAAADLRGCRVIAGEAIAGWAR